MRLRTFTAPTMAAAMHQVRESLGEDAVIVSTRKINGGDGVCVTAAHEDADETAAAILATPLGEAARGGLGSPVLDRLAAAIAFHATPAGLAERLVGALADDADETAALASALIATFAFQPLPSTAPVPLVLVGPPGAGKTVTVAKIAARAVMAGDAVRVITTDNFRAGGAEQLRAFADILGVAMATAGSPRELQSVLAEGDPRALVIVDTAGINPFAKAEVVRLAELLLAAAGAPVLVLPAGVDAADAGEIGGVFREIGATRLLATRVDAARRLGAVLSAADCGDLAFSAVSVSPHVSRGLETLDAHGLAGLLLARSPHAPANPDAREATP